MIRDDSYVVVVSRENPLSKKKKISLKELAREPLIMPAPASALRKQLDEIFAEHEITPNILSESSQSDMVISLASAGLGVGISSRSIAERLQDGSFAVIPLDSDLHRSIYYVTLKELLDYPSIHSFTNFVRRRTQ